MVTKSVDGSMTYPDTPGLGIWTTAKQSLGSGEAIFSHFKSSGFNVDRDYLAIVSFFDLRPHLRYIKLIAASSKFLFAIAGLANCHKFDLINNVVSKL
jgi:hypothetical protein